LQPFADIYKSKKPIESFFQSLKDEGVALYALHDLADYMVKNKVRNLSEQFEIRFPQDRINTMPAPMQAILTLQNLSFAVRAYKKREMLFPTQTQPLDTSYQGTEQPLLQPQPLDIFYQGTEQLPLQTQPDIYDGEIQ
jgi:hypothetical protein